MSLEHYMNNAGSTETKSGISSIRMTSGTRCRPEPNWDGKTWDKVLKGCDGPAAAADG